MRIILSAYLVYENHLNQLILLMRIILSAYLVYENHLNQLILPLKKTRLFKCQLILPDDKLLSQLIPADETLLETILIFPPDNLLIQLILTDEARLILAGKTVLSELRLHFESLPDKVVSEENVRQIS